MLYQALKLQLKLPLIDEFRSPAINAETADYRFERLHLADGPVWRAGRSMEPIWR
jgi:hypothetical protein